MLSFISKDLSPVLFEVCFCLESRSSPCSTVACTREQDWEPNFCHRTYVFELLRKRETAWSPRDWTNPSFPTEEDGRTSAVRRKPKALQAGASGARATTLLQFVGRTQAQERRRRRSLFMAMPVP